jgi:hypothetical protein
MKFIDALIMSVLTIEFESGKSPKKIFTENAFRVFEGKNRTR